MNPEPTPSKMNMQPNLMRMFLGLLRTALLWPAYLVACFRPYVGGWYVGPSLILLSPIAGVVVLWISQGFVIPGSASGAELMKANGSGLGILFLLSIVGVVFNRWRHFKRLDRKSDRLATHSTWPGVWWFGLAPTLLWWVMVLPFPILITGLLLGASGMPMLGAFLVWLGISVCVEGILFMHQQTSVLVMRMDATALNGAIVTDEEQLAGWAGIWRWIMTSPLRDPDTGKPTHANGPGQVIFFNPEI